MQNNANRPRLEQETVGGSEVVLGWPGPADAVERMIAHGTRGVKSPLLAAQAAAAEKKAAALASWHFERAARYLAWAGDSHWAAQRYRDHVAAAEFQQRMAARHRAVRAALGEVKP